MCSALEPEVVCVHGHCHLCSAISIQLEDGHLLGCALMMEAVSSSEMLVSIYLTAWHNIPEDSHHCHENLKSH
jgi:hypothetical protein